MDKNLYYRNVSPNNNEIIRFQHIVEMNVGPRFLEPEWCEGQEQKYT